MGFASEKIQGLDDSVRSTRRKVLNQDPSQKSGSLSKITQPAQSAVTNALGTASNVGHVAAKISGVLGATGLQKALEGSSSVTYHDTYGKKSGEGGKKDGGLQKGDRAERSGRSLVDFCQAFSGNAANSHRIDTECTFSIRFDLEPGIPGKINGDEGSFLGGIISRYVSPTFRYNKKGEIEWVLTNEQESVKDFIIDVLVQKMTLPNITLAGGQTVQTLVGDFPVNGLYLQPDQHTFTLDIVNLRDPIHEQFFYAWMREITAPFWVYQTQPYTTANIAIDLSEHMGIQYVFLNARPSNILTMQPTQEPVQNFTRQVQFTFDWMKVEEKGINRPQYGMQRPKLGQGEGQGVLDKIQKIGNAANFSASNILKI